MSNVIDLDILRPEKRIIKLGGEEIDVSYIPCAITFEIDEIISELAKLDMNEIEKNGDETRKAFDISLRLCATFCEWQQPKFTKKWLADNCDVRQINVFAQTLKTLLSEAYKGAEDYGKN